MYVKTNLSQLIAVAIFSLLFIGCINKPKTFEDIVADKLRTIESGLYRGNVKLGSDLITKETAIEVRMNGGSNSFSVWTPPYQKNFLDPVDMQFSGRVSEMDGEILYFNISLDNVKIIDELFDVTGQSFEFEDELYYGLLDLSNKTLTADFELDSDSVNLKFYSITVDLSKKVYVP